MLSERLSTQPIKDITVSDSFILSVNPNQTRSTPVSGFSSHIGLSHRMFPFRIRCQEEQRPPKSEMLTTSCWRMHWQSGVRVNAVQEVHHPMHNTNTKKQRINTRKITLFLPLISQMIIDNQSQQPWHCPLLFLKNIFNQPARLLHNNSKFWMSEYSFVFFFLNNCWFFTSYSLLFLRSKN